MVVVDKQIPNQGRRYQPGEGEDVWDSVDVFMACRKGELGEDAFCGGVESAYVSLECRLPVDEDDDLLFRSLILWVAGCL